MSVHEEEILQSGQEVRPEMTVDTAVSLVQRLYGLKVKSIQELDSYLDKNYLVVAETQFDNPHIEEVCGDGYVLKVLNSVESKTTHVGKTAAFVQSKVPQCKLLADLRKGIEENNVNKELEPSRFHLYQLESR